MAAADTPSSIVKATWLAAYQKAADGGSDKTEATERANSAVRRAHGSSARADMYNKQVLVDHFKGKRSADDPEVERQFRLLRQQAEIDWNEMYAGKNTKITPQSIAEDYIGNAKGTADVQRKFQKIKIIAGFIVVAVILFLLLK
jgi:hypothetical protein